MKEEYLKLGLNETQLDREPQIHDFPSTLNNRGFFLWCDILNSGEFSTEKDKWKFVISEFFKRAKANHIDPWKEAPVPADNIWIRDYLRFKRKRIIRFMDNLGLLQDPDCWKLKTKHTYEETPNGFWIHSQLYIKKIDKRETLVKLKKNFFFVDFDLQRKSSLGYVHWRRWLIGDRGISKVGFAAKSDLMSIIYTSIFVPRFPYMKDNRKPDNFILTQIWYPLVFQFRYKRLSWIYKF